MFFFFILSSECSQKCLSKFLKYNYYDLKNLATSYSFFTYKDRRRSKSITEMLSQPIIILTSILTKLPLLALDRSSILQAAYTLRAEELYCYCCVVTGCVEGTDRPLVALSQPPPPQTPSLPPSSSPPYLPLRPHPPQQAVWVILHKRVDLLFTFFFGCCSWIVRVLKCTLLHHPLKPAAVQQQQSTPKRPFSYYPVCLLAIIVGCVVGLENPPDIHKLENPHSK